MSTNRDEQLVWKCLRNLLILLELFALQNTSASAHSCPNVCICASDLISCVNQSLQHVPQALPSTAVTLDLSHNNLSHLHNNWLAALPRLQDLRISHNQIKTLSGKALHNATQLKRLDLSSNRLEIIKEHFFEHLLSLEELLLYNNVIMQVDRQAFIHLSSIRKIYLSCNLLTNFSFRSMQNLSHPYLRTLDLSSNNFSIIPIEEVMALPAYVKNGLYLHNNPLTCDCRLYNLFLHWTDRGFSSAKDFQKDHICLALRKPRAIVRFLNSYNNVENCPLNYADFSELHIKVFVGKSLLIPCNTSLQEESTNYLWISPRYEFIKYPGNNNQSLKVHNNGSLEIKEVQPWDSGIYLCIAINNHLNHNMTYEVNVTVHYPKYEGWKTGFTTLLGCVVSLILVLVYLYLTPCHCFNCRKKLATPSPSYECSAKSSILSTTPPATDAPSRKINSNKHVVFLEPIKEVQNGKIKLTVRDEPLNAKNAKVLQPKSDSESTSSVFSDIPIMSL
ncbi:amphoterin-induced protein 3 [Microcaecilia unicolor]|uniref:Amphoterin-induced protein 3 n=1 Tax=Microcaecilia unicolor TaxID=1415580 RepID=A0A6P7YEA8_9AMPH|nr:amphoterin-induced protein 3 [Microcaecilia unicolor]